MSYGVFGLGNISARHNKLICFNHNFFSTSHTAYLSPI